jgi:fatty-acyl-CoA synthase
VPTMIYLLTEAVKRRNVRMPTLERFVYGGSPILAARLAEAHALLGNIFTQSYGQSESLGAGTALFAVEHRIDRPDRLASCGRAMPGVEIALLDDEGRRVASGEAGELCMRTRSAMRGYWKQPQLTEAVFAFGWLHTGDIARVDADGFFTIVDRKKDMIVSGGYNVYPAEVERVIAEDPTVRLVAVIGVPDEKWGEAVTAFVIPHAGAAIDVESIVGEVRRRKGGIQAPKRIEIVEDLPLTSHGKIDKKALRARFWEGHARNVN